LRQILAERLATRPSTDWLAALEAAEIPSGAILDVREALATPQAQARRMTVELKHPTLGAIRQVGLPFELSGTPASIRSAPPLLGEHTDEILGELGFDPGDIDELHAAGVTKGVPRPVG
jgi:formyl-CoA transferase/CoA:oxalate CoA-transferase